MLQVKSNVNSQPIIVQVKVDDILVAMEVDAGRRLYVYCF